jgi:hypothetical protein
MTQITSAHVSRDAFVYVQLSTSDQVLDNPKAGAANTLWLIAPARSVGRWWT